jgi:hypothetical protein
MPAQVAVEAGGDPKSGVVAGSDGHRPREVRLRFRHLARDLVEKSAREEHLGEVGLEPSRVGDGIGGLGDERGLVRLVEERHQRPPQARVGGGEVGVYRHRFTKRGHRSQEIFLQIPAGVVGLGLEILLVGRLAGGPHRREKLRGRGSRLKPLDQGLRHGFDGRERPGEGPFDGPLP